MKLSWKITFLLTLLLPAAASAEKKAAVRMEGGLRFEWNFDNREFAAGGDSYTESMTIFGARLTPSAGLRIRQRNGLTHSLRAGVDLFRNFGQNEADGRQSGKLARDITFWYTLTGKAGKTRMTGIAGVYPRHLAEGEYSPLFYSDSVRFYDNNLEGLLLKFRRPRAYWEVGLDWDGKKMEDLPARRERFQIFTYCEGRAAGRWLFLGWTGVFRHFAASWQTREVVDNHLLQVFARCDLSPYGPWDRLSLTAAYVQGYHRDRAADAMKTPFGGEFAAEVSWKRVGVQNRLYYGGGQQPFYETLDGMGRKYGRDLYQNSPFYRIPSETGLYDRVEIFCRPRIGRFVDLNMSVVLHFAEGYQGWQQKVSLVFDLDRLLRSGK